MLGCGVVNPDAQIRVFVECESMHHIKKAFAACEPIEQYTVGCYKVDLYLKGVKIAVECDEHGHRGFEKAKESFRQSYIEKSVDCKFVRFNPDAQEFDIMTVIARIVQLITSTFSGSRM